MGKDLTVPEGALSETMAALNAKQRAFVEALFTVKPGHGSLVAAARVAGYGENSSPENLARIAFRLAHNPKVVAAIQEITAKSIRKLGPAAVRAVEEIVTDPTHRDQLKAARTILEHAAPVTQHHTIDVNVKLDPEKDTAEAIRFLFERGATREKLIADWGAREVERVLDNVVDADFTVIEPSRS